MYNIQGLYPFSVITIYQIIKYLPFIFVCVFLKRGKNRQDNIIFQEIAILLVGKTANRYFLL